ncbi:MAG: SH3 domain-containing protein [Acidobacteriota bacterium]|nr:SH3 domain-containing protein [Acidobacteriota bacterium]MDW3228361.1 SH3 domain-containing protein [Acidobacteriota bacterium]MDY0231857.1 SH3 domain-containing protein [Candidatus Saccharicenans sp.]
MKNVSIILLIAILALSWLALDLEAQEPRFRIRVVTEQANIRVKPDIGSEMIFQVPQGTELEAEKKEGEWYLVNFDKPDGSKGRGYVHESLVEVLSIVETRTKRQAAAEQAKPITKETETEKKTRAETQIVRPEIIKSKPGPNFMVTVSAGGIYLTPADLNQSAKGVANYFLYSLHSNEDFTGKSLHLAWGYSLDFFYPLSRNFFIGLGFDYWKGSKETLTRTGSTEAAYSIITRPEVKDLPLRISLLFHPIDFLYIRAGLEVHLAKANYFYRVEEDASWMEWKGRTDGLSLGWVEAVGLKWSVFSWCQVFLEGSYRYARVKNFDGKNIYRDSTGLEQIEEGKLYYWEVETPMGNSFPALFVRDRKPTEPGVIDPRQADINYSGFSLRAGLRFVF